MGNNIPYIDKIIPIITSIASPDQIILFGSYARGDNTEKIGKPNMYRWLRIGTDLICVSLGFSMGNMPGVGTLIMALFTGPLFAFFRRRISVWGKKLRIITW